MHYLFSRAGLKIFDPFLEKGTLIVFDFDGTLAPIVSKPEQARMLATTARLLKTLSLRAPVALLSGRAASDLKARAPFSHAWIGNHGAEGLPGSPKKALAQVARWRRSLEKAIAPYPDITLEDKRYSLSLHYRRSRRRGLRHRILLDIIQSLRPSPRLQEGKCVLNVLSPMLRDKGGALLALMKKGRHKKAIFVGDDLTDEDVFRLNDPRIFTLRIGRRKNSQAMAYLKNQREVDRLLQLLQ